MENLPIKITRVRGRLTFYFGFCFVALFSTALLAQNTNIKITQIYYNGGVDGDASFANDFIELYNDSDQDVDFNGEYALAIASFWQKILTGTIKARSFYLIQYASGFSGGAQLPTPDFTGDQGQDIGGTRWVLFYYQAGGFFDNPTVIDDVDFRADAISRAPTTDSSTLAVLRKKSGGSWQDTGAHASDFQLATPFPRNSAYIAKTTPTLNWGTLTNIVYPATLSTNQLSATSSAPGAFVYTLTSGTNISTNTILNAGTNKLVASFTPTDTNAYNTPAPITNTLVVNKGAPIITWISPVAITYGTALSGTQNNATSTVAGGYSYNPTNGSLLNAGTSSLVVTFTPSDTNNYISPILKTNTITVNKANQTITFGPLSEKVVGDAAFSLSASGGGSGNAVTFASSDSNVATISSATVTVIGKGTSSITASQAGNSNWSAATNVIQALTVKSRFAAWSGTETMTTQSVVLYAIGGASNTTATAARPSSAVSGSNLTLTAIVRTNDPKLTVVGEASTNLTAWTNSVTTSNSPDTNGVPLNHVRKTFSVPQASDGRKFLRLKATLSP